MAKLTQTDSEKLANSLADLARRIRNLETFNRTPLGQITLHRTTNQSIASGLGSPVAISWDTQYLGSGFTWVIGSPTKIFSASQRSGERIEVAGFVNWASNGTGRREAYLKVYSVLNVLRETYQLFGMVTDAGGVLAHPFYMTYGWTEPTDYFTIEVGQNSGSPLNLSFAQLSAKIVH
jgi:hypothetical protein